MNEIMKNMDELKDKLFAAIDTICKDYETKKPEFKIGQWVIGVNAYPEQPSRITAIRDIHFDWDNGITHHLDVLMKDQYRYFIRPATPQEIESHLRKICDEKYIGKKVKCLNDGKIYVPISKRHGHPFVTDDSSSNFNSYWMLDDFNFGICVFKQGKWAEIIPDKKKLPCTKDEAIKLIQEYASYYRKGLRGNVFDFVNDYTD